MLPPQITWPSAGRAWELLHGAKIDMHEVELSRQARQAQRRQDKRKRVSEDADGSANSNADPNANSHTHGHGHARAPSHAHQHVNTNAHMHVNTHAHTYTDDGSAVVLPDPRGMETTGAGAGTASGMGVGASGKVRMVSLTSLDLGGSEMGMGMQSASTMQSVDQQRQRQQQQSQLPQSHRFALGMDVPRTSAQTFQGFDRWSTQEGFHFPASMSSDTGGGGGGGDGSGSLTSFVSSGNLDSSAKGLWKDFPEQFADPSLITSSLYGLPVISGPMQGQTPSFLGDFSAMYSSEWIPACVGFGRSILTWRTTDMQSTSGSNTQ